jgi:hypothetical protein
VANVCHLQTNYISPQFNLIHDDNFETILNDTLLDHPLPDDHLLDIFNTSRKVYADIEQSNDGAIVFSPPPLDNIWLDDSERHEKNIEPAKDHAQARDCWKFEADSSPIPIPTVTPTGAPPSL